MSESPNIALLSVHRRATDRGAQTTNCSSQTVVDAHWFKGRGKLCCCHRDRRIII
ncbi:hypothetical protein CY34DRAFT_805061 [Suillus luteus UH-Slu-Lm8-n1]|uniref:Uncharacterized protein n=1 Tax=Suillus luteus UH-Slu-Lm8-n1 TaxID=930992 RepID=A0A0D0B789_9AGAM|nr:hypothetical protein CY34DRAFT_805061 [Suillus luteus UH-Slu-Lm8-n1]